MSRYLAEMPQVNVNGGAEYAAFSVKERPDLNGFAACPRWREAGLPARLLRHPALRKALPQMAQALKEVGAKQFHAVSAFTLEGLLAQELVHGGAYRR